MDDHHQFDDPEIDWRDQVIAEQADKIRYLEKRIEYLEDVIEEINSPKS